MDKYRKDDLVSYLACLNLLSQNSSFGWRMSVLLYKALGSDGGNSALSTLQLQKDINSFKWVCTDVDESYSCFTVFVTFNMPAFHYIHSESKSPIRMIPALDIVDNPMIVFES